MRVVPHNPNGPISTLAGVHLGACTANFEMLEYPRQPEGEPPVFRNQPTAVDGYLEVPTGPGWGVEIDEEKLARMNAQRSKKVGWPKPKLEDGSVADY